MGKKIRSKVIRIMSYEMCVIPGSVMKRFIWFLHGLMIWTIGSVEFSHFIVV